MNLSLNTIYKVTNVKTNALKTRLNDNNGIGRQSSISLHNRTNIQIKYLKKRNTYKLKSSNYIETAESGGSGGIKPPESKGYGGGDSSNDDNSDENISKKKVIWKGWHDRVQCDPTFPSKVLIEQVIGVTASVLGDMSSRPNWGIRELDFVFATLVVGSIVNFMLMYLLAPTPVNSVIGGSGGSGGGGSFIQKFFSEEILKSWGCPGGHMFEAGFTIVQRAVNIAYKGVMFGVVGICAGLIGTALSNCLILIRKKLDPKFVQLNESPNVALNALAWGCHMGFSSNIRYQLLYGVDLILVSLMGPRFFLLLSATIRTLNNVLGGVSFVWFARILGVQKVNEG